MQRKSGKMAEGSVQLDRPDLHFLSLYVLNDFPFLRPVSSMRLLQLCFIEHLKAFKKKKKEKENWQACYWSSVSFLCGCSKIIINSTGPEGSYQLVMCTAVTIMTTLAQTT